MVADMVKSIFQRTTKFGRTGVVPFVSFVGMNACTGLVGLVSGGNINCVDLSLDVPLHSYYSI